MKRSWRLVVLLVAWPLAGAASAQSPPPSPAPVAVLGYLVLPDVTTAIAHADALAQSTGAGPGAGMLQSLLGQTFGDPDLANLRPGQPAVLMVFQPRNAFGPPDIAWFLPLKDPSSYESFLTSRGWKTQRMANLLLAGLGPGALAAAAGRGDLYQKIEQAQSHPDARLYVRVDLLLQAYGSLVRDNLDKAFAPATPSPTGPKTARPAPPAEILKLVRAESRSLLGLLAQVDEIETDVVLDQDAVGIETRLAASAESPLAALCNMTASGPNPTRAFPGPPGFVTVSAQTDPVKLAAFVASVMRDAIVDPDAAGLLTPELIGLAAGTQAWFGGQLTYTAAPSARSPLGVRIAMTVTDEVKAAQAIERGALLAAPGTPWARLYEDMGVKLQLSVARNQRVHGKVSVNRVKMSIAPGATPAVDARALTGLLQDTEWAVTRHLYLAAQDPAALDTMIDRALAKSPGPPLALESVKRFGEGRQLYADYDVVGLFKTVAGMSPDASLKAAAAELPAAPPVLLAVTLAGGSARAEVRIPIEPFVALGRAAAKARPAAAASPQPKG